MDARGSSEALVKVLSLRIVSTLETFSFHAQEKLDLHGSVQEARKLHLKSH